MQLIDSWNFSTQLSWTYWHNSFFYHSCAIDHLEQRHYLEERQPTSIHSGRNLHFMRKTLLEMSKTFVWHRGLRLIFPWMTRMHCHWWTRWSWRLCWVVLQHQDELGGSSWSTSWALPPPWNINITVLVLLIIFKFSSLLSLSPSSTVDGGLTPFVSGKKSTRPAAGWW